MRRPTVERSPNPSVCLIGRPWFVHVNERIIGWYSLQSDAEMVADALALYADLGPVDDGGVAA